MRRTAAVLALSALVLAGCGGEPEGVQYPPGQRPCSESLRATDAVLLAQVASPSGSDPSGQIREALDDAREPLAHRAGESPHYDAAAYNRAADDLAATLDPLIEAFDAQDDVPFMTPEYQAAIAAYDDAEDALLRACDRR